MVMSRYVKISVIALIGLSFAGCKTSTAVEPPAASATGTAAPASGATAASSDAATPAGSAAVPPSTPATLPASCPTAAQVSSILAISAPQPVESRTATTLDCAYVAPSSAANSLTMNFSTAKKLTPASAEAALRAQGVSPHFQAVPGLGDAAFFDTAPSGGAYIAVISGALTFHIVVSGAETLAELTAMARAVLTT